MSPTAGFSYADSPFPIREDIRDAHRRAWERVAPAGNWWTGAERVEIARESRNALDCPLCAERKAAVSPFSIDGTHHCDARLLSDLAVDAVHRLVTDPSRLTATWLEKNAASGLSDGHYVELLGVVVTVLSIDELHRGLGLPLEPLPAAVDGAASRVRPEGLASGIAWVPMLPANKLGSANADLYDGIPIAANVIAAMSLVPDAVRQLKELSTVHYLPMLQVANPQARGRVLTRPQIELIAGRVSALNECFY